MNECDESVGVTQDEISELLNRIDVVRSSIISFAEGWHQKRPPLDWNLSDFKTYEEYDEANQRYQKLYEEYDLARRLAYYAEVFPLTMDIVVRSGTILGEGNELVLRTERGAYAAGADYRSALRWAGEVQRLRVALNSARCR